MKNHLDTISKTGFNKLPGIGPAGSFYTRGRLFKKVNEAQWLMPENSHKVFSKWPLITLLVLLAAGTAFAQSITPFSLPDVASGQNVSLESYANPGIVVVIFSSNVCPYDAYYKDRIRSLINSYSGKVSFLLVNSYIEPEEGLDQMKVKSADWSVPYLADKDQTVLMAFNAHKSPEAFLLKYNGGTFTVQYSGAIDDNAQVAKDARQNYLKDAIDKTLSNQNLDTPTNRAAGCSIRRK